tara:strand:+ start:70 stop:303 length:234 start_codon:yes stop_codon:yes gene_type:complete
MALVDECEHLHVSLLQQFQRVLSRVNVLGGEQQRSPRELLQLQESQETISVDIHVSVIKVVVQGRVRVYVGQESTRA